MPTTRPSGKSNDEGGLPTHVPPVHPVVPLKGILKNKTEQSPIAPNVSITDNSSGSHADAIINRIPSTNIPTTSFQSGNEFENHHFASARDSKIVTMERLALGKGKRLGNSRDVPSNIKLQLSTKKRHDEDRDPNSSEGPGNSVNL